MLSYSREKNAKNVLIKFRSASMATPKSDAVRLVIARVSLVLIPFSAQENAGGDASAKPDEATLKKLVEQQEKVG